jgi:hypothetical protein
VLAGDPFYNVTSACFLACSSGSDCPDPMTYCGAAQYPDASACLGNGCGRGPYGPNTFGPFGLCDSSGVNDGTCLPHFDGDRYQIVGACVQGGDAGVACDPRATRATPWKLCPAGSVCIDDMNGGGICALGCSDSGDAGCLDAGFSACVPHSYDYGLDNVLICI